MIRPLIYKNHSDLAIRKTPVVEREEFLDFMTFRSNKRPLFDEIFGPLLGLKEEWLEQGATPAELDFSAFRYRCPNRMSLPVNTGLHSNLPYLLLEETDDHIISRDSYGRRVKLVKQSATIPLPMEYPVKTWDDWKKIKHWYAFNEQRLAGNWESLARDCVNRHVAIQVSIPGGFDEPRQLMGEEELCVAFYEQPELVHDMLQTMGETARRVLDCVSKVVPVDILFVHEDMAGKSGPLAGPLQIREFIKPYYRACWDLLQERGARVFLQDSDGDMRPVIQSFIECGLNAMLPLEPAAGMDIVQTRQQFGRQMAFWGGIDKHVLRQSKADIEKELLYKVPPMIKTGGCILALDHRIPNGTPLENYRFYIQKMWEILDSCPS
jgi:hypothetical protein